MKFFENLTSADFWCELTRSDFNCGYLAGAGLVVGLLLLLLIVRLIFKLLFRTRRSGTVVVPNPDGDLVISRDAVENAARHVLDSFEQLDVRRIQLYRKGKRYSLTLFCSYAAGEKGLPELSEKLKPQLLDTLRKMFGISNLSAVRIQVEKLSAIGGKTPQAKENETENPTYVAPGF